MRKPSMKYFTREKIVRLVTKNKVTIFVAKLFGMVSKFNVGENVCLVFDRRRKFQVVSNIIIEGKIRLVFFNENSGLIESADIEPKYLDYSYIEGERLKKLIENSPDGLKGIF